MINSLNLFPKSIDSDKLEKYITETVESFKSTPGFLSHSVSAGDLMSPAGPPAYSKVLEASFESLEAFMGWVNSPWAQSPQAQAYKNEMIENGAILLFYEVSGSQ